MSQGFGELLDDVVQTDPADMAQSEWCEDRFLNPTVPKAVQDDPDGSFHKGLQITNPDGSPLTGLAKGDEIPLMLRPYQRVTMNKESRLRALRWSRRTGKTFLIGLEAVSEAFRDPNGQVLVLAPAQSQIKVIFDDYIRPLLRAYQHRRSDKVGIDEDLSEVGRTTDYAIATNTQKPQEIVISGTGDHRSSIRGMVMNDTARGQSASLMIIDEADYADNESMQEVVAPILMTRPNTRILMVSTPSGRGDTFFRSAFSSDKWWTSHQTFKVLPHYDEELHQRMAELAGGEDTNAFKREYLAQWGSSTEGVFDEEMLRRNYVIAPYPMVMEVQSGTERKPALATARTNRSERRLAYYEGVRPMDHQANQPGGRSVYRPAHRGKGVVTAGTDWNKVAGMQTVIIWWPPEDMLENGELSVARYGYDSDAPITTRRKKDEMGNTIPYTVGRDNGDPGGPHDLSQVEGIVLWHGRLESGSFTAISAANRVCSMMGIDNFIDAWYVDKGYGMQINQIVKQIMETGEWQADQDLLYESQPVDSAVIQRIRKFHPEKDPEQTGKLYRTIRFGESYDHRDIDFTEGEGMYKDVMINLIRRMVSQRRILFPHAELTGFHHDEDLGSYRESGATDVETGEREQRTVNATDRDELAENGGDVARGESYGGLVTQMQSTRIDGYTPKGRPRYTGDWHAVDGLMLANLAYWENFTEAGGGNMFRVDDTIEGRREEDVFQNAQEASEKAVRRRRSQPDGQRREGDMSMPSYSEGEGPLRDLIEGRISSSEAGTPLNDQVRSAMRYLRRQ